MIPLAREEDMMIMAIITSALFHVTPVGLDMASTEYGLKHYESLREANIQDRNKRLAINLGIAAASTFVDHKLEKKKGLQWAFRIAHLALGVFVIHHNIEEIQRARTKEVQTGY